MYNESATNGKTPTTIPGVTPDLSNRITDADAPAPPQVDAPATPKDWKFRWQELVLKHLKPGFPLVVAIGLAAAANSDGTRCFPSIRQYCLGSC